MLLLRDQIWFRQNKIPDFEINRSLSGFSIICLF
jgi:hypothetical protein